MDSHRPSALGGVAGGRPHGRKSPSPEEVAWAEAETGRILGSLPLPRLDSAEQVAKSLDRMRPPLVEHLSRSRRGLPPDGHLRWAVDLEQLLHKLLACGWSLPGLSSVVSVRTFALTPTAAEVQLRLDFLQREGGFTAQEAAKAIGNPGNFQICWTPISTLQGRLKQLQSLGFSAAQLRNVFRHNCRILATKASTMRTKLDCLRGANICGLLLHESGGV